MATDRQTIVELVDRAAVTPLAQQCGLGDDFDITPLPGGANNRVFRLSGNNGDVVLKVYFRHEADQRDRLRSDFDFATFAWNRGLAWVPKPLAIDVDHGFALYQFIDGNLVASGAVTARLVKQAARFFVDLNQHRMHADARRLPLAAEAFFSVADHLNRVDRRVLALSSINGDGDVDRSAKAFVLEQLIPLWKAVKSELDNFVSDATDAQRCLSPSDFGFHNALELADGSLRFIDFEYAGWDDPAKTICDFFCQPKRPVPFEHFGLFSEAVASAVGEREKVLERARRLLPVYRVKWACILLNEFMPVDQSRRRFAGATEDLVQRKSDQLEKAKRAIS